jgi:hypothetical protein
LAWRINLLCHSKVAGKIIEKIMLGRIFLIMKTGEIQQTKEEACLCAIYGILLNFPLKIQILELTSYLIHHAIYIYH